MITDRIQSNCEQSSTESPTNEFSPPCCECSFAAQTSGRCSKTKDPLMFRMIQSIVVMVLVSLPLAPRVVAQDVFCNYSDGYRTFPHSVELEPAEKYARAGNILAVKRFCEAETARLFSMEDSKVTADMVATMCEIGSFYLYHDDAALADCCFREALVLNSKAQNVKSSQNKYWKSWVAVAEAGHLNSLLLLNRCEDARALLRKHPPLIDLRRDGYELMNEVGLSICGGGFPLGLGAKPRALHDYWSGCAALRSGRMNHAILQFTKALNNPDGNDIVKGASYLGLAKTYLLLHRDLDSCQALAKFYQMNQLFHRFS